MSTITLPKKEYDDMVTTLRKFSLMFKTAYPTKKKAGFSDTAFGLFKQNFGKKPSLFYVSKMRKTWRV